MITALLVAAKAITISASSLYTAYKTGHFIGRHFPAGN